MYREGYFRQYLNADGFQDVLVGDPGNDTAGADFGVAWIFYGSGL